MQLGHDLFEASNALRWPSADRLGASEPSEELYQEPRAIFFHFPLAFEDVLDLRHDEKSSKS